MHSFKKVYYSMIVVLFITIGFNPLQATAYNASNAEVSDPLESVNRAIYGFNRFLDKIIIKPAAKTYRFVLPKPVRKGIRNALENLTEPLNLLNSTLQGDKKQAYTSFWRFAVNSTFGLAGTIDVAEYAGLEYRKEDFGQTLGYYGTGSGPYLMLPILGPSNTRDIFGRVVDSVTDPFNYAHEDFVIVRTITSGIDGREELLDVLDEIDRVSLDPYAATRSLYAQRRASLIKNGNK